MKEHVRQITSRRSGRSMKQVCGELGTYLRGWKQYFALAGTPRILEGLDKWIHRGLRMVQLKQWKRGRTAFRELRARGVPEWLAVCVARFTTNWWRVAAHGGLHVAFPVDYFATLGVVRLSH